jgi:hypothetical protein
LLDVSDVVEDQKLEDVEAAKCSREHQIAFGRE